MTSPTDAPALNPELIGPTYEEAEDSNVIPQGPYTLLIEKGGYQKSANPSVKMTEAAGVDVYTHMLRLETKIVHSGDPKYTNWRVTTLVHFNGPMCFRLKQIAEQVGLNGVQDVFDKNRETYLGDELRPVFTCPEEEAWERIAGFYMNGEMVDDNGVEFTCESGGLLGKSLQVTIDEPKKLPNGNIVTGDVKPVKV